MTAHSNIIDFGYTERVSARRLFIHILSALSLE